MSQQHFQGLRTAIYKVKDIKEATEWYTKILGFGPYFNEPFYVGFSVGGYELGLMPEEGEPKKGLNVVVYWGAEQVQQEYDRLKELGAREHEKPEDVGSGIIVATLLDPWDNVFGIIHNPYFGQNPQAEQAPEAAEAEEPGVTAPGGIFFKSPDPDRLKKWYAEHLGVQSGEYGTTFIWHKPSGERGYTAWSPFSEKSDYFGNKDQQFMVNYRVKNLKGLLEKLKQAGVEIPKEPEAYDYGNFGWITDCDGNRVELWEPHDENYGKMGGDSMISE